LRSIVLEGRVVWANRRHFLNKNRKAGIGITGAAMSRAKYEKKTDTTYTGIFALQLSSKK
jgi:hypothetical protein